MYIIRGDEGITNKHAVDPDRIERVIDLPDIRGEKHYVVDADKTTLCRPKPRI